MNSIHSIIGTALLLAGAAAAAQAPAATTPLASASPPPLVAVQQTPPGVMRDQTRVEVQQRAAAMFAMLDANKDGSVTKAEAQAALAQFQGDGRRSERMQRMLDQAFGTSSAMTLAQFSAIMLARFDASDLNHDGTVTAAEREQARAMRQAQKTGQ